MSIEKEIKELEKNRRLSARAIPVHLGFLVVSAVVLWILRRFISLSVWVPIIVLGLTVLTLIGDIYNVLYCGRRARTLRDSSAKQRPPEDA